MAEHRPLRPGDPERVGAYRLISILGEGGQGIVYLGKRDDDTAEPDGQVRRLFAIKLLRAHLGGDERARRYFAREVAAAQRIDPSFTAPIVEADLEVRAPYIVSEYVDGHALSDRIRAEGPLTGAGLHQVAVGTLNALVAIHQANVVHRDFKPSNVLLGTDRPRVIDFGIARALDVTMSASSGIVGTPAFMAPEQLNGQQVTPAVDVFAWGATMVFAATGAAPFGQDSIPVMMHRILSAEPYIGDIQGPMRDLVWYCLYKEPTQRPTAKQALALLSEAPRPVSVPGAAAPPVGQAPTQGWSTEPPPQPPTPAMQPGATTKPPARAHPRWLPVAAVAASIALVAGFTALAVRLTHGDSKSPSGSSGGAPAMSAVADAALTRVVNPSTAKGGTLRLVQAGDFDSLDPGNMYFTGSWNFSRLYARSLLTYPGKPGAAGLRPVPDLATGPGRASADLKTWTYQLRTGVRFEDGTPVTAKDVRYAVARTFASDVLTQGPTYFRDLLDAGSYDGPYRNRNLDSFTGVTTPDDHTVVFHLKQPYADFDYVAALPQTAPVPAAKDTGAKYTEHPISTGPYKVASHVTDKAVTLVRNPSWRPDGIRTQLPDQIAVTFNPDATAVDQALLNDDAYAEPSGQGLQSATIPRALLDPNLKKNTDTITNGILRYVALSTKMAPFNNVHCRLAVQYAVDRKLVETAAGGPNVAQPATNLAPPTLLGSQKFDRYPANIAKAKQELAACGRPSGFTTKIAIRQVPTKDLAMAQAVQNALARVGIRVSIVPFPTPQYYTDYAGKPSYVHKHGLGMILASWGPDYPMASGFFPLIVDGRKIQPSSNSNLAELNDPQVNATIDRLGRTADQTAREGLTTQLDRQVMNTGAVVPLAYDRVVLYRNPGLTNAVVSQMYAGYDMTLTGTS